MKNVEKQKTLQKVNHAAFFVVFYLISTKAMLFCSVANKSLPKG